MKTTYPWHLTASRSFAAKFLKLGTSKLPKNGLLRIWFQAWTGVTSPFGTTSGDKLKSFSRVACGASVYDGGIGVVSLCAECGLGEHTENKCAVQVRAWPFGSVGLLGSPWMCPKHGSSRL